MNELSRTKKLLVVGFALCWTAVSAASDEGFVRKPNVAVPMSDGNSLTADIFLPDKGQKFPTILLRTPYSRMQWADHLGKPLAQQGYAVVLQDVRGQQGSAEAGDFHPIVREKKDGLDTLDWIAAQPWSNGAIGMWGSSYNAYCGLILTPENHPNLKAVVNISGWGDSAGMVAPGGAMHLMCALPWSLSNQIHGKGSFADYDWPEVFKKIPVSGIPKSIGIDSPQWEYMLKGWNSDVLHQEASIAGRYDRIHTPILHITGWNDFICRYTLDIYEGVAAAQTAENRPFQKLVVGPWRHDQYWGTDTKVGDEDFGAAAQMGANKIIKLSVRWFDRWLKGKQNSIEKEPPVRLFVMGKNEWREFDRWPPAAVKSQKWYFGGSGSGGLAGNGTLSTSISNAERKDEFVFDPLNPVPTTGGVNFHFFLDNLGVKDQRPVENRRDVLVYTSPPLKEDLDIIGPLQAVVYASSEGRQTDFTAKLVEVRDDGYARIIEDGIKRGPDGTSQGSVTTMEPDQVYRFTIDLGATAIAIPKGHQLRVEISSSNFPKYSRNPNTGEPPEFTTEFKAVRQTLYHSPQYASYILLPCVTDGDD